MNISETINFLTNLKEKCGDVNLYVNIDSVSYQLQESHFKKCNYNEVVIPGKTYLWNTPDKIIIRLAPEEQGVA